MQMIDLVENFEPCFVCSMAVNLRIAHGEECQTFAEILSNARCCREQRQVSASSILAAFAMQVAPVKLLQPPSPT